MRKRYMKPALSLWPWGRDQHGITGLETAIVLIAFVVVASVFAFAVLSTGLLSSEKSKETIIGGLEETSATLVLRGSVIAKSTATPFAITNIVFQVTNASQSGEAVNLNDTGVNAAIVTYLDEDQTANVAAGDWAASWLTGSGNLVNPGETVEIDVTITGLSTKLKTSKKFTIQVKPTVGATLIVGRTTPAELTQVMDLN